MQLQCPFKEQGMICPDPECPACLDELFETELGDKDGFTHDLIRDLEEAFLL